MKMREDVLHKTMLKVCDNHYWRVVDDASEEQRELLEIIRCDLSTLYEALYRDDYVYFGKCHKRGYDRHNLLPRDDFYKKYGISVDKYKQ